jgi:hypothetical protein
MYKLDNTTKLDLLPGGEESVRRNHDVIAHLPATIIYAYNLPASFGFEIRI